MRKLLILGAAAAAAVAALTTAVAAVIFDPGTGTGFVGKGDVQDVYGWNDAQLQANAGDVQFRASSVVVTEVSWTCSRSSPDQTQTRTRTTTTTTSGLLDDEPRLNPVGHVTGFDLLGYDGDPVTSSESGGPPLNSCPAGPWSLTTPAGDPVVVSETSSLEVSINGTDWYPIP